jgi:DNA ligase-1
MILGYNWFLSNPRGWLMSEKLEGVRGKWDGAKLLNRHGKSRAWAPMNAPQFVLDLFAGLPAVEFEIWHGRGNYRETMKLFQLSDPSPVWQTARFGVFDAPDHAGTIEERAAFVASLPLRGPLFAVKHEICRSLAHLQRDFAAVYNDGGEGLVLRKAGSAYLNERTTQFLKVKCRWW